MSTPALPSQSIQDLNIKLEESINKLTQLQTGTLDSSSKTRAVKQEQLSNALNEAIKAANDVQKQVLETKIDQINQDAFKKSAYLLNQFTYLTKEYKLNTDKKIIFITSLLEKIAGILGKKFDKKTAFVKEMPNTAKVATAILKGVTQHDWSIDSTQDKNTFQLTDNTTKSKIYLIQQKDILLVGSNNNVKDAKPLTISNLTINIFLKENYLKEQSGGISVTTGKEILTNKSNGTSILCEQRNSSGQTEYVLITKTETDFTQKIVHIDTIDGKCRSEENYEVSLTACVTKNEITELFIKTEYKLPSDFVFPKEKEISDNTLQTEFPMHKNFDYHSFFQKEDGTLALKLHSTTEGDKIYNFTVENGKLKPVDNKGNPTLRPTLTKESISLQTRIKRYQEINRQFQSLEKKWKTEKEITDFKNNFWRYSTNEAMIPVGKYVYSIDFDGQKLHCWIFYQSGNATKHSDSLDINVDDIPKIKEKITKKYGTPLDNLVTYEDLPHIKIKKFTDMFDEKITEEQKSLTANDITEIAKYIKLNQSAGTYLITKKVKDTGLITLGKNAAKASFNYFFGSAPQAPLKDLKNEDYEIHYIDSNGQVQKKGIEITPNGFKIEGNESIYTSITGLERDLKLSQKLAENVTEVRKCKDAILSVKTHLSNISDKHVSLPGAERFAKEVLQKGGPSANGLTIFVADNNRGNYACVCIKNGEVKTIPLDILTHPGKIIIDNTPFDTENLSKEKLAKSLNIQNPHLKTFGDSIIKHFEALNKPEKLTSQPLQALEEELTSVPEEYKDQTWAIEATYAGGLLGIGATTTGFTLHTFKNNQWKETAIQISDKGYSIDGATVFDSIDTLTNHLTKTYGHSINELQILNTSIKTKEKEIENLKLPHASDPGQATSIFRQYIPLDNELVQQTQPETDCCILYKDNKDPLNYHFKSATDIGKITTKIITIVIDKKTLETSIRVDKTPLKQPIAISDLTNLNLNTMSVFEENPVEQRVAPEIPNNEKISDIIEKRKAFLNKQANHRTAEFTAELKGFIGKKEELFIIEKNGDNWRMNHQLIRIDKRTAKIEFNGILYDSLQDLMFGKFVTYENLLSRKEIMSIVGINRDPNDFNKYTLGTTVITIDPIDGLFKIQTPDNKPTSPNKKLTLQQLKDYIAKQPATTTKSPEPQTMISAEKKSLSILDDYRNQEDLIASYPKTEDMLKKLNSKKKKIVDLEDIHVKSNGMFTYKTNNTEYKTIEELMAAKDLVSYQQLLKYRDLLANLGQEASKPNSGIASAGQYYTYKKKTISVELGGIKYNGKLYASVDELKKA